jgi:hypothetical protein
MTQSIPASTAFLRLPVAAMQRLASGRAAGEAELLVRQVIHCLEAALQPTAPAAAAPASKRSLAGDGPSSSAMAATAAAGSARPGRLHATDMPPVDAAAAEARQELSRLLMADWAVLHASDAAVRQPERLLALAEAVHAQHGARFRVCARMPLMAFIAWSPFDS